MPLGLETPTSMGAPDVGMRHRTKRLFCHTTSRPSARPSSLRMYEPVVISTGAAAVHQRFEVRHRHVAPVIEQADRVMAEEVHGPGVCDVIVDSNQDRCGSDHSLDLGERPKRRDRRWIEALVKGALAQGETAEERDRDQDAHRGDGRGARRVRPRSRRRAPRWPPRPRSRRRPMPSSRRAGACRTRRRSAAARPSTTAPAERPRPSTTTSHRRRRSRPTMPTTERIQSEAAMT